MEIKHLHFKIIMSVYVYMYSYMLGKIVFYIVLIDNIMYTFDTFY